MSPDDPEVVGERRADLSQLDRLTVPEMWPLVMERVEGSSSTARPSTRGRGLAWLGAAAAAVLVIVGVVMVRSSAGRSVTMGTRHEPAWGVVGSHEVPVAKLRDRVLLAPFRGGVWVAQPGGDEIVRLVATADHLIRTADTVPFEAVAAIAAEGSRLWVLDVGGHLSVIDASGRTSPVAAVGAVDSRAGLTLAGGQVWVTGLGRHPPVSVDTTDGRVVDHPNLDGVAVLDASGDALWAIGTDGSTVRLLDPASGRVLRTTAIGPLGDLVATPSGLAFVNLRSARVELVRTDGSTTTLAVDTSIGVTTAAVGATDGLVWLADSQVISGFDPAGSNVATLVVGRDGTAKPDLAGTGEDLWVAGSTRDRVYLIRRT